MDNLRPEIVVFAGPNGSGKSTVTRVFGFKGEYINADDIKSALHCDDLEAAQKAEAARMDCIDNGCRDFTFETVLSTDRNLKLLKHAKENGYFIRCIYVLTTDPDINVLRVKSRVINGGHDVPRDKIVTRYWRALSLLPQLLEVCDICNVYDNSDSATAPKRIFKKRKDKYFYAENIFWNKARIAALVKMDESRLQELSAQHLL